jgi:hypothetical protein
MPSTEPAHTKPTGQHELPVDELLRRARPLPPPERVLTIHVRRGVRIVRRQLRAAGMLDT